MSIDRKALRAKTNRIKWERQDREGLPGRYNEYGNKDLTPYNSARVMWDKQFSIKYR